MEALISKNRNKQYNTKTDNKHNAKTHHKEICGILPLGGAAGLCHPSRFGWYCFWQNDSQHHLQLFPSFSHRRIHNPHQNTAACGTYIGDSHSSLYVYSGKKHPLQICVSRCGFFYTGLDISHTGIPVLH